MARLSTSVRSMLLTAPGAEGFSRPLPGLLLRKWDFGRFMRKTKVAAKVSFRLQSGRATSPSTSFTISRKVSWALADGLYMKPLLVRWRRRGKGFPRIVNCTLVNCVVLWTSRSTGSLGSRQKVGPSDFFFAGRVVNDDFCLETYPTR